MASCDKLSGCPFFNDRLAGRTAVSEMLKKHYCQGDFMACARHIVCLAKGSSGVPSDLFPNQQEKLTVLL